MHGPRGKAQPKTKTKAVNQKQNPEPRYVGVELDRLGVDAEGVVQPGDLGLDTGDPVDPGLVHLHSVFVWRGGGAGGAIA